MEIFTSAKALKEKVNELKEMNKSIGFVPTMGALHPGHISLVEESVKRNDITIASIFVNPIQFNDKSDLENYPRTVDLDVEMLNRAGCDILFLPDEKEMYPESIEEEYDFGHIEIVMEGKHRPGHFNGVAIVVSRLFDIVMPNSAYFGLKDYQQYLIIKKLSEIQNRQIQIVGCPTVREKDGLAMSSRNARLSVEGRKDANKIHSTLLKAKRMKNTLSVNEIKDNVEKEISRNDEFILEYFEIVDAESLISIDKISENQKVVACIAVFLENVRLIDNIEF